jgi:hypothetical protein
MSNTVYIDHQTPTSKCGRFTSARKPPSSVGHLAPETIARMFLRAACGDPGQAVTLVRQGIRGGNLQHRVISAIGTAFLRTSADRRTP